MRVKIILGLIFIVGFLLRIFDLTGHPPALNWDEVSQGYNAYSILKTGKDEWGQLPITNFKAFGDYPTTLYMYTLVPFVATLGLNEFSVRLPSVIYGTLLILVIFYLNKRVFKSDSLALVSALLMAISPWSLMLSRQAIQVTPALLLTGLGLLLWLKGVQEKRRWLIYSTISFGLSAFAYHNSRIIAPIILLLLAFFYRKVLLGNLKILVTVIILAALFFIPVSLAIFSSQGSARANWVGILDQGAINRINQSRTDSNLPAPLPKLLSNKITYFAQATLFNYMGYFNPLFLGFEGGSQYQFSVPGFGVVYPIELPFFYLGLILLLLKFPKLEIEKRCILMLLLVSAIPAAITRDSYQVVRAAILLIPVNLITVFGFGYLTSLLKSFRKLILGLLIVALVSLFIRYLYNYWFIYPRNYSFAWQFGYKQVVEYLATEGGKYNKIFITKKYGEPHEFVLFFIKYDPEKYRTDPSLVRFGRSDWYWVDRFDKYFFVNDWLVRDNVKCQRLEKCLLITSPGNFPAGWKFIKAVNFLDGSIAFEVLDKT